VPKNPSSSTNSGSSSTHCQSQLFTTNAQYWYQSNAKDQQLISKLEDYLMQGKLELTTPAYVFAASPTICKDVIDKLKVHCIETNKYKVVPGADL